MNNSQGNEWHPWLKMFTILSIPAGFLFLLMSCGAFNSSNDPFVSFLTGVVSLILPIGGIYAGFHTLKVTDYFRRWSMVTGKDRFIAYFAIYLGINLAIALFFVAPFTRFLTDAVGGGLGISSRN